MADPFAVSTVEEDRDRELQVGPRGSRRGGRTNSRQGAAPIPDGQAGG